MRKVKLGALRMPKAQALPFIRQRTTKANGRFRKSQGRLDKFCSNPAFRNV